MSGIYPATLRSVLKAVPSIVMAMTASYCWFVGNYAFMKSPNDHVPKSSYRFTKFGKYCNQRDDRKR
jgi:hypothetical protein